ncbi:MAG: lamin tail domain-containing protein [Ignavibacteriales bacterium]|nr:lamin tail domain-containing protein [Ignavibacteriales bacterium]
MRKRLIVLAALSVLFFTPVHSFGQTGSVLTLSEIMFNPSESNGEFIEIYNTSTTETVNLTGFKIKYYTSTADNLVSFIGGLDLQPGKYAVILENDYDYNNGAYKNLIPADAIVLKISDASFGTSGMANTTSRDVSLLNASSLVVDTYTYSADNNAGISDEKYLLNKDNSSTNWRNGTTANGTPGKINSVTPVSYLYNLTVRLSSLTPANPVERDSVAVNFIVKNNGVLDAANYSVEIFRDANADSIEQVSERIFSRSYIDLSSNDSIFVEAKFYADQVGQNLLIAKVTYAPDEKTSDNKAYVLVNIAEKPASYTDVVINEIMYAPANDEPEWIELYNRTDHTVNLKNWKVSDNSLTATITTSDFLLQPNEYVVISSDATISSYYTNTLNLIVKALPSFSNTGDDVILKSGANITVDSVKYSPTWGGNTGGKSLERVSFDVSSAEAANWKTSVSKYRATPSKINSVSSKNHDLSVKSFSTTAKYAEIGKTIQLKAVIENLGKNTEASYSVKLFRDMNLNSTLDDDEKIDEIIGANIAESQTQTFNFSVTSSQIGKNRFIVRVDLLQDEYVENNFKDAELNYVVINEQKGDLVFNEIMLKDGNISAQWVELYNNSTKQINIRGYKINSKGIDYKIIDKDIVLAPEEYFITTTDSLIYTIYPQKSKFVQSVFKLHSPGNRLVLLDSLNRGIDSLEYKSAWSDGKSLERIDWVRASADSTNWKTSSNELGGTPGSVNSHSQKKFDIAVSKIIFAPSAPVVGQKVKISAGASNIGKNSAAFKFVLNRVNKNGSKQKVEESNTFTLAKGESFPYEFTFVIDGISAKQTFEVVADYSADEDQTNNSATAFVRPGYPAGTVLLNEVMYNPLNGEPEWIELYNNSAYNVDLEEWSITDVLTTPQTTKIFTNDFSFPSKTYLIVAKDSTIKDYHKSIFGKLIVSPFANLNNDADGVVIKDSRGAVIDSLLYDKSWGGEAGKSLERVAIESPTNAKTNWSSSKDVELSSPGKINTVSQKDFDLEVTSITSPQNYGVVGKKINMSIVIKNIGKNNVSQFSVKLYRDGNKNGFGEPSELVYLKNETNLAAGASSTYNVEDGSYLNGINNYLASVEFAEDQFADNNQSLLKINCVVVNEERNDLVINEIMYAPLVGEPEWIEIYNNSTKQINLKGYQIGNGSGKSKVLTQDVILKPEEYFVAAKDSAVFTRFTNISKSVIAAFPTLNNTKDKIVILDSLDRTIDSLEYKSSWGGTGGKSLERLDWIKLSTDSTNWKASVHELGATPGFINSISQKKFDVALTKLSYNPTMPLAGQRVKISASATNKGKNDAVFKFILYRINKDGSKQKVEETNTLVITKDASLTYDFTFAIESILTKQTYEAVAEFNADEDLTNNSASASVRPGYSTGTVYINEVMYNPLNGEPEWIELYNASGIDVDLEDWSITDVLTTPQKQIVKAKDSLFPKYTFVVIAKDSAIKNFHREIPSKLIITTFANLNNDADGVVIKDSRDVTIDSVRFENKWGGENGKSLERKLVAVLPTEKTNWGSSKDLELSTPGRINSIAIKKYDLALKAVVPKPVYPAVNEDINIGARVINYGTSDADKYSIRYFVKNNNAYTLLGETSGTNLKSNDSLVVYSSAKIKLSDVKTVLCKVIFSNDEDTLNNYFSGDIIPGAKPNSVLITEVMYDPLSHEPEWVEFLNTSNEAINLKNWAISDLLPAPTKVTLTTNDDFIQPGEYAIATPDTQAYAFIPPKKFYQTKFGSLGNTSDGVMIYDFRGAVIDSFFYKSAWGGNGGSSLERISLTKATSDSTNWTSSISTVGASPGIKNASANPKSYKTGSLVFNEILYEPETGGAEFVELYNTSNDSIQIGGMDLLIGAKERVKLSQATFIVPPKEFFVLASDSAIYKKYSALNKNVSRVSSSLSFSNEGTSLLVKDLFGTTLDSVVYSPSWHNRNFLETKNKSLERLNPALNTNDKANWSTSVTSEGATPGKQNSIYTQNLAGDSKVNISPNPFSPDNDGFEDFAIINFNLPYKLSQVQIKVFDSQGRLVRTLLENRPSATNNSVIFNGLDDEGRALRIGIYILLIEIAAEGNSNIETIKKPIVVARKL